MAGNCHPSAAWQPQISSGFVFKLQTLLMDSGKGGKKYFNKFTGDAFAMHVVVLKFNVLVTFLTIVFARVFLPTFTSLVTLRLLWPFS